MKKIVIGIFLVFAAFLPFVSSAQVVDQSSIDALKSQIASLQEQIEIQSLLAQIADLKAQIATILAQKNAMSIAPVVQPMPQGVSLVPTDTTQDGVDPADQFKVTLLQGGKPIDGNNINLENSITIRIQNPPNTPDGRAITVQTDYPDGFTYVTGTLGNLKKFGPQKFFAGSKVPAISFVSDQVGTWHFIFAVSGTKISQTLTLSIQ